MNESTALAAAAAATASARRDALRVTLEEEQFRLEAYFESSSQLLLSGDFLVDEQRDFFLLRLGND